MIIASKSILLCSIPSHTDKHALLGHLCSMLCLHLLTESPQCNFLFALSWTETHQRSAELEDGALLTSSLPHVYQFLLLHLHELLLLAVLARGVRRVLLLWLQFGQILTSWNRTLTQKVLFIVRMC